MGLVDLFKFGNESEKKKFHSLYEKAKGYFPDCNEREIIISTCIAGLCARVAYVDMKIGQDEAEQLKKTLKDWTRLADKNIDYLGAMAIEQVKDFCGMENHLYSGPLNDILDKREKVELLVALFALSAADGAVSNYESEEIRLIAKSLRLNDQYYLAARATVLKKLQALKK
ncbi:MAG: TerB family tellurite resistance protein [Bacteriovoracaceae bacterium]|nr:TerB family tellurite resistance protein [Bacteriovoracaceae bacterium]